MLSLFVIYFSHLNGVQVVARKRQWAASQLEGRGHTVLLLSLFYEASNDLLQSSFAAFSGTDVSAGGLIDRQDLTSVCGRYA